MATVLERGNGQLEMIISLVKDSVLGKHVYCRYINSDIDVLLEEGCPDAVLEVAGVGEDASSKEKDEEEEDEGEVGAQHALALL